MGGYGDKEKKVYALSVFMDKMIDGVEACSIKVQDLVQAAILSEILKFDLSNGSFVIGQDFRKGLLAMDGKINATLSSDAYSLPIKEFLSGFSKVQDRTVSLFKSVNELELSVNELAPARQLIYELAQTSLTGSGIASQYIEPVKKLVAQNVIQGQSISETTNMLDKWGGGELSSGKYTNGTPTPNLSQYAVQVARDTAYSVNRAINNIASVKFGLKKFIYAGSLVRDSRPLCKHLVGMDREIGLAEMPPLIRTYPQGLYPGTTEDNWLINNGGYSCRHISHPV